MRLVPAKAKLTRLVTKIRGLQQKTRHTQRNRTIASKVSLQRDDIKNSTHEL